MQQVPSNPFLKATLGAALTAHKTGDLVAAEAHYRRALAASPKAFDALSMLGTLLCQKQRFAEGLEFIRQALEIRPNSVNALLNLGLCLQELERHEEALAAFESGYRLKPEAVEFLRGKAVALFRLGNFGDALVCYDGIFTRKLATLEDQINQGVCLYELGRFEDALGKFKRVSQADKNNAAVLYNIGRCLLKLGLLDAALAALEEALRLQPAEKKTLIATAETLREMGRSALALPAIGKVLDMEPGNPFACGLKGALLLDLSRPDEAIEIYRDLARRNEMPGEALQNLAFCKKYTEMDADAELVLNGRNLADLHPVEKSLIQFGAAKCLNDLGRFDEAFAAAVEARNIRPKSRQTDYDFDAIAAAFNKEILQGQKFTGNPTDQPVFVVGMPRSGTTLIEQIIASHPDAHGAGELHDMFRIGKKLGALESPATAISSALQHWSGETLANATADYLRSLRRDRPEAARIVDKMPHNFVLTGAIALLFPNARIIHSTRHAADTCVSIFMNDLKGNHGYADDLAALGEYYGRYSKLMAHWKACLGDRLFTSSYEQTVQDPEGETRKLLEFVGLPWNDRCLRFFETERAVTTHSRAQVRQPLYATSVQRWKRYEKHLAPLLASLRQAGLPVA